MTLRNQHVLAVLAFVAVASGAGAAQDEAKAQARASAKEWLALLDDHRYDETWKKAGKLLKGAVSQGEWSKKMSVTLGPMGKTKSRAARSSEYSTTMPGAPEGEYVVVKFDTTFESSQTALETVVMGKEAEGEWRVQGYFIR